MAGTTPATRASTWSMAASRPGSWSTPSSGRTVRAMTRPSATPRCASPSAATAYRTYWTRPAGNWTSCCGCRSRTAGRRPGWPSTRCTTRSGPACRPGPNSTTSSASCTSRRRPPRSTWPPPRPSAPGCTRRTTPPSPPAAWTRPAGPGRRRWPTRTSSPRRPTTPAAARTRTPTSPTSSTGRRPNSSPPPASRSTGTRSPPRRTTASRSTRSGGAAPRLSAGSPWPPCPAWPCPPTT